MSSESTDSKSINEQQSEESIEDQSTKICLTDYPLGASLSSLPLHPLLLHALNLKGVELATRTQLAFFSLTQKHDQLLFPLNRGGGRFVAFCLRVLNFALQGTRTLVVVHNEVLRRYICSDLQTLGTFCPLKIVQCASLQEFQQHEDHDQVHVCILSDKEALQEVQSESSFAHVVVVEPEHYKAKDVHALLEAVQAKHFLGLYQNFYEEAAAWKECFPSIFWGSYNIRAEGNKRFLIARGDLLEQIQQLVLCVPDPCIVVCSSEAQAQSLSQEIQKIISQVVFLSENSLRRNKEQSFRLLQGKRVRLLFLSREEYNRKVSFSVINLCDEPIKTEKTEYWIPTEAPEQADDFIEMTLPALAQLKEQYTKQLMYELQCAALDGVPQEVEDLFAAVCDQPLLLKVALKDCLDHRNQKRFDQQQEILRIEQKESFSMRRKRRRPPQHRKRRKKRT